MSSEGTGSSASRGSSGTRPSGGTCGISGSRGGHPHSVDGTSGSVGLGEVTVLPMGERAVLVEVAGIEQVVALAARLRADERVAEVVPAARTVLVLGRVGASLAALRAAVHDAADRAGSDQHDAATNGSGGVDEVEGAGAAGDVVEVEVTYDGPDLEQVAELTGLTPAEVVAAHTGAEWSVAFGGFAPGFGYLAGGDPRLVVPRRDEPRARVPAGAVGLAGEFSGVYPRASPGGWQIVGTTRAALWDERRDPPALLAPGARVRFVVASGVSAMAPTERGGTAARGRPTGPTGAADGQATPAGAPGEPAMAPSATASASGEPGSAGLRVEAVGPLALVEDLGRWGYQGVGVSPSGAADRGAHRLANRLLGNPESAATVEVTGGGLMLHALSDQRVCLTGARVAAEVDGRPVPHAAPFDLRRGARLTLGVPRAGLRTYVGVRGGIALEPVLGSRSTDTLSGLGPSPLTVGTLLTVGEAVSSSAPLVDHAPYRDVDTPEAELEMLPGPRRGWFLDEGTLTSATWSVSSRSDRVGVRLEGARLIRRPEWVGAELASEGLVRGCVQVPPGGEPVVMLADHPVTGGYPVIGVLTDAACDLAAQLRPGQAVRLRSLPARSP